MIVSERFKFNNPSYCYEKYCWLVTKFEVQVLYFHEVMLMNNDAVGMFVIGWRNLHDTIANWVFTSVCRRWSSYICSYWVHLAATQWPWLDRCKPAGYTLCTEHMVGHHGLVPNLSHENGKTSSVRKGLFLGSTVLVGKSPQGSPRCTVKKVRQDFVDSFI